ncbi:VRR-NUC domain-containing protein [Arthrobacter sp. TmT3-37]
MSAPTPNLARMYAAITEKQLQRQVEGVLTAYRWRWYHAPDNRPVKGRVQRIKPGFPDILAVRGPRLVAIELKTEADRVAPEQREWHKDLAAAGAEVYLWRPSDINTIRATLA